MGQDAPDTAGKLVPSAAELLENTLEGVLVYDEEGFAVFANASVRAMLGTEPIGRHGSEFVHPEERDLAHEGFLRLGASPDGVREVEQRVLFPNETGEPVVRWVRARLHNMLEHPEIRGIVSYFQDITEFKEIEDKLIRFQKVEAASMAGAFAAHELNNLLTVILGNLELMQLHGFDAAQTSAAFSIEKAVKNAATLTGGILSLSRAPVANMVPIRVSEFLARLAEDLEKISGSDVALQIDAHDDDLIVYADRSHLEHAALNLALNGIQAMARGGRLSLESGLVDLGADDLPKDRRLRAGRYVRIAIADTGPGIPEGMLDKIFEPLFTTRSSGTGMGLSIVDRLISASGGFVTCSNRPQGGAIFTINLPRYFGGIVAPADTAQVGLRYGTGRVLVIEHDREIGEFVGAILSHLGYEPALISLRSESQPPDVPDDRPMLILIDTDAKGEFPAVADILDRWPQAATIALGAPLPEPLRTTARHTVLAKPFGATALSAAIRRVLDGDDSTLSPPDASP